MKGFLKDSCSPGACVVKKIIAVDVTKMNSRAWPGRISMQRHGWLWDLAQIWMNCNDFFTLNDFLHCVVKKCFTCSIPAAALMFLKFEKYVSRRVIFS